VDIGPQEYEQVASVLDSGWVSPGRKVESFEKQFSALHDTSHGVMVNSGTDALRIALATLKEVHGWQDGDEVLVPALTFVATVNIVLQNKLTPVFVDVNPDDFNLNHQLIRESRTEKTRAIIPVHMFGLMADMYRMKPEISGLKVIEDSCETMGTRFLDGFEDGQNKKCYGRWDEKGPIAESPGPGERCNQVVGSFGDIACFSTYSCHLIVTGVGGIAITNNSQYAEIMRSYANHGRDPYFLGGYSKADNPEELIKRRFLYHRVGYSSRVSEFEAAMGLAQLNRLPDIVKRRALNATFLDTLLSPVRWNGHDGFLQLPNVIPVNRQHAFMMFPIVIRDKSIDRDELCLFLESKGIETRPLMPLLTQPVYREMWGDITKNYPVAHEATTRGFYVGCHQQLTDNHLEYLARTLIAGCLAQKEAVLHVAA
jgi:dTDP-4-amino-4,6-dideoxygalactose transaminase